MENVSQFIAAGEKTTHKREYDVQPLHIKFENNDSEGSDASYQSSLSSSNSATMDADTFRQQMSRFFINHPELLNHQIIDKKTQQNGLWGELAKDIINQAKDEPISLQNIAKRITYYRQKSQQNDIIDMIIQEKDLLLKELEEEAKLSQQEIGNQKEDELHKRAHSIGASINTDHSYFSWRKRHQVNLMKNLNKMSNGKKSIASSSHSNDLKPPKESSHNRLLSQSKMKNSGTPPKTKFNKTHHRVESIQEKRLEHLASKHPETYKEDDSKNHNTLANNLLKFQPKTEPAKHLLEEIKKHSPSDELAIKKTIINYLVKYRQSVQKQIMSKTNLPQRISKLHLEDSKQLLLFCQIKQNIGETQMPLSIETGQFLQVLQEISSGHLMKYWKLLQEKKL